jgi:hypothetical protein
MWTTTRRRPRLTTNFVAWAPPFIVAVLLLFCRFLKEKQITKRRKLE